MLCPGGSLCLHSDAWWRGPSCSTEDTAGWGLAASQADTRVLLCGVAGCPTRGSRPCSAGEEQEETSLRCLQQGARVPAPLQSLGTPLNRASRGPAPTVALSHLLQSP